jgi:hypothetical protein
MELVGKLIDKKSAFADPAFSVKPFVAKGQSVQRLSTLYPEHLVAGE